MILSIVPHPSGLIQVLVGFSQADLPPDVNTGLTFESTLIHSKGKNPVNGFIWRGKPDENILKMLRESETPEGCIIQIPPK